MRFFTRTVILLMVVVTGFNTEAQEFTNNWIDFSQEYYRFGVPRTGVYRIYREQFEAAGVPISKYNPQNIQLIQNGKPIACHIDGESSGLCRYIEFFAEANDGSFDTEMYDSPESQPNQHYSLVTDEAAVFITFNSSFSNLRFTPIAASNTDGYESADYCLIDTVCQYASVYMPGEENCIYTTGEGWFDATALTIGRSITKIIPTPNIYADSSLSATFSMSLGTYSSNWHHLTISFADFYADTIFAGIRTLKYTANIPTSKLSARNNLVISSINDIDVNTDYSRMAYAEIVYPATFDFTGRNQQIFELPADNTDKCVTISGMALDSESVLYDITRNLQFTLNINNDSASAIIPAHSEPVRMIVINKSAFASIETISKSAFVNHAVSGNRTVIISHKSLMEAAERYAEYRNAYLVDVEDIYNQFGYGISRHPLAIRKFIEYISLEWSVKPENLFIIGKGITVNTTRRTSNYNRNNLIAPMGYPASDALLSAYINGSGAVPTLATGRLSALTETDVDNYLTKVKAFEDNKPAEWMKRVLHFCGGKTTSEQNTIRSYMTNYERIISDTLFGGSVTSFYKTTSDPISTSKNDSVDMLVNSGISLMTFFGHGSAGGGFDQDIDAPSTFKNEGKYPLILSNSCYTGNIYGTTQTSVSENWVLIPKKGAIGLIAMVNEGVVSYLNRFSSAFYKNLASNMYGKPIGQIMRCSQESMATSSARLTLCTIHQMTLHGDPCIVLNSPALPDLQISPNDITFSPKLLSTEVDSFNVNVTIRNIGRAITSPFTISIKRQLANGDTITVEKNIDRLNYKFDISFRLPIDPVLGIGVNSFTVSLDAKNSIEELSEENNSVSISTYISSNLLRTVSPYRYSLIPQVPHVFAASTTDALSEEQTSVFQIDTTEKFSSVTLHSEQKEHNGGIVRWKPTASLDTATTYYWRVGDGSNWSESSFITREGLTGWEQSHFEQIDDNTFSQIDIDSANRNFTFSPAYSTLRCHNIGSPNNDNAYMSIYYAIDRFGGTSSCGVNPALLLVVIDSTTLKPWFSTRGQYGQSNYPKCSSNSYDQYFIFYMHSPAAGVSALVNMIENYVPDGNYFMVYSFISGKFQQWPDSAYQAFEEWGAERIRLIDNSVPYIFFSQKGYPEQAEEVVGTSATEAIDFARNLQTAHTSGSITSQKIGPSSRWTAMEWHADSEPTDRNHVNVIGIESDGTQTMLICEIDTTWADLSGINADRYKYLQLQFATRDDSLRTPSQLKSWRVLYNPYTDLAVSPQQSWLFYSDTLTKGEYGRAVAAFENIGSQESDSLLVHYWIQTETNKIVEIGYHRLKNLKTDDYVTDTVIFATSELEENNVFYAELNPCAEGETNYDQPELTHFNNFIIKPFVVLHDISNPLMDVTIDGRHIQDGEIVSATPSITIRVTDENKYFAISDTNSISVYITPLTTGIEEKIDFSKSSVRFEAGAIGNNEALLQLSLKLEDDTYLLRVRAHDVAGNETGTNDYIISFVVVNEPAITDIYAFPNPFSSSTRFAFDITGSVLPDNLQIDIYSTTGKIVRTLTLADFDGLHIGRNLSACVWNGTNSQGAPLPNGVYFYKMKASIGGKQLKRRPTTTSSMKNGVGRIVIIR